MRDWLSCKCGRLGLWGPGFISRWRLCKFIVPWARTLSISFVCSDEHIKDRRSYGFPSTSILLLHYLFFFFRLIPIWGRHSRIKTHIWILAGLLQSNSLPAANLPKEENARRKFFTHTPPEIWPLFTIEADVGLESVCDEMQYTRPPILLCALMRTGAAS